MKENFIKTQDKAISYYNSGYNCSEAVVLAVCEYLDIDSKLPLSIATPFGSGMSRNGSTCGALSAAFIAAGLTRGRKNSEDSRDPSYLPADAIFNKFKEKYGSTACEELTGVCMRDPEVMAQNKERLHKDICGPMVRQVTQWILEELEK